MPVVDFSSQLIIESYLCEVVVTGLVHSSPLLCYFLGKSRLQFSSASLYRFYENRECCLIEQKM